DFEALSAYLDGELDAARRAEVEAYLEAHPEARAELECVRERERRLAEGAPGADGSPEGGRGRADLDVDELTRRVWEEVDRHRERSLGRGFWGGRGFPGRPAVWIPLAAAAALLLVFRSLPERPREAVAPRRAWMAKERNAAAAPSAVVAESARVAVPHAAGALRAPSPAPAAPPRLLAARKATLPRAAAPEPPATPAMAQEQRAERTRLAGTAAPVREPGPAAAPSPAPAPAAAANQAPAGGKALARGMASVAESAQGVAGHAAAKPEAGEAQRGGSEERQVESLIQPRGSTSRFPPGTMRDMTLWMVTGQGPGASARLTPEQRDSVIATVERWRNQVRADSSGGWRFWRGELPQLGWALTERYERDHRREDCAAARAAFDSASFPSDSPVARFIADCRARLGDCAPDSSR
ncbi:MAG TPA: hypothetical protein VMS93_09455, partial [Candidatus Saccharimonadales bacterium]|nr:hypothetical protein [Candidatus Saccharimonadales bacterium]